MIALPTKEIDPELAQSLCEQDIHQALMAMHARHIIQTGYHGHHVEEYEEAAGSLVEHLRNAILRAELLSGVVTGKHG